MPIITTRPHYPSNYDLDNIIAVAATDHNDQLGSFSHWGATSVDLAAPGVDILSTIPGSRYGTGSGTSMAAPHVAGVAALAWTYVPHLTNLEVKEAILAGVDPLGVLDGRMVTGGRLDARNTLDRLVSWVAIDVEGGSLPAGASTDINVSFNSHDMADGSYEAFVVITSNDPATPELSVPLQLVVNDYPCGDVDGNLVLDMADFVYLMDYYFRYGVPPDPAWLGDANCDGFIGLADVAWVIDYLYGNPPRPCCR